MGRKPGEEVTDFEETVNFLINILKGSNDNAFWINKFVLFPETQIFKILMILILPY